MNDGEKNAEEPKIMKVRTHIGQKHEGKIAPNIPLREEKKNLDVCANGHAFWVLTCPKSKKRFSQEMVFSQI